MGNHSSTHPYNDPTRLSDADRNRAFDALSHAVGEGRLNIEEFEKRTDAVLSAETRSDLAPILADIPAPPPREGGREVELYTQGEINQAWQSASKQRLATAIIGTIALVFIGGSISYLSDGNSPDLQIMQNGAYLLIPILWVLLYVAKIGPASWKAPSPRQIARQRRREIAMLDAQEKAERKALEAQAWARRRQQAGELTDNALNIMHRKLREFDN